MRRLRALITGLPATSAATRAVAGWSPAEELAAVMVEQVHELRRTFIALWSTSTPPDSLRLPRPNDDDELEEEIPLATSEQMRAFFQGG